MQTGEGTVSVFFTDFWNGFDLENNFLHQILKSRYRTRIDPRRPDFLFFSCYGYSHLEYNCTRICWMGENLTPDFSVSDYGIGFDYLTFADRYYRLPLYLTRVQAGHGAGGDGAAVAAGKTGFCNFIYSNGRHADPARDAFFFLLSKYRKVDSGGRHLNNIGSPVRDKVAWQRRYKFSIAFENSSKPGYTTEKIYDCLCADTVPIYWGDPRIADEFNPARFVNCHDYGSFAGVVERVKELDGDQGKFAAMLGQPWFRNGTPPPVTENADFAAFIYHIVDQGPAASRRNPRYGWTGLIARRRRQHYRYRILANKLRDRWRLARRRIGRAFSRG